MKKLILLAAITLGTSLSAFAQEACNVGYTCELTSGQNILRQTTLVQDESLLVCQVVTLANYGKNAQACTDAANLANR